MLPQKQQGTISQEIFEKMTIFSVESSNGCIIPFDKTKRDVSYDSFFRKNTLFFTIHHSVYGLHAFFHALIQRFWRRNSIRTTRGFFHAKYPYGHFDCPDLYIEKLSQNRRGNLDIHLAFLCVFLQRLSEPVPFYHDHSRFDCRHFVFFTKQIDRMNQINSIILFLPIISSVFGP